MPSRLSIIGRSTLIETSSVRVQKVLRELAGRSLGLESTRIDEARSVFRHPTKRELLSSNPNEAIARRLGRIGVPPKVVAEAVRDKPSGRGFESQSSWTSVGLERILGRNELLAIRYLDGGRRAGKAVARIIIRDESGRLLGYGTGSLISPRLLMTNHHVLESAKSAAHSEVQFNYQIDLDSREGPVVTFALRPDVFFYTSNERELDLTIVAVEERPRVGEAYLSDFGYNPLASVEGEILAGESVTIIQHPRGELKQIALRENQVLKFPEAHERFLYYQTDTTPGSSGAPVFNDQWEVVALHHSGFPRRDAQGRILTPEGQLWTEEMGDERIDWIANEGIRVAAIRSFLDRLESLTVSEAELRDEAVAASDPPTSQEMRPSNGLGRDVLANDPTCTPSGGSQTDVIASRTTWTIPLRVTVDLGIPQLAGATPIAVVATAQATSPPASPSPHPPVHRMPTASHLLDQATETDSRDARLEFEHARARTYYDPASDEKDRRAYYDSVLTTLDPLALYKALNNLLTHTHARMPAYKPMLHVYPWVDLQPNRKIKSVYSGKEFEALKLIEQDAEIAARRRERYQRLRATESMADPVVEAVMLEELEAALPYNCEHVVPQSWFRKREPMRGDLHHLFACEPPCNSFRGNIPYFDFSDFNEAVRSECGRREDGKFEPEKGKGAVARATLYFLLRYPGEINANAVEYKPDRLSLLLHWHGQFPPDEYERHRNQAIFAAQGNRNPLIDLPELAEQIDFAAGLG